jgi:hypothetical protein
LLERYFHIPVPLEPVLLMKLKRLCPKQDVCVFAFWIPLS